MAMGLFYYGLKDTSATYATNLLNLIPIVTFLFSTILRYLLYQWKIANSELSYFNLILINFCKFRIFSMI